MIKMTKESILLALLSHEKNQSKDLEHFQKKLMDIVVENLSLMSSQWAQKSLKNLKAICVFPCNGCEPPEDTWKLDKDLDEFYCHHPWSEK